MTIPLDSTKVQRLLSEQRSLSMDALAVAQATVEQLNELVISSFKIHLAGLQQEIAKAESQWKTTFDTDAAYAEWSAEAKERLVKTQTQQIIESLDHRLPGFAAWRASNS